MLEEMADVRLEDGAKSSVRYVGEGVSIAIPTKYMQRSRRQSLRDQTQSVTSVEILADRARNQAKDPICSIDAIIAGN